MCQPTSVNHPNFTICFHRWGWSRPSSRRRSALKASKTGLEMIRNCRILNSCRSMRRYNQNTLYRFWNHQLIRAQTPMKCSQLSGHWEALCCCFPMSSTVLTSAIISTLGRCTSRIVMRILTFGKFPRVGSRIHQRRSFRDVYQELSFNPMESSLNIFYRAW